MKSKSAYRGLYYGLLLTVSLLFGLVMVGCGDTNEGPRPLGTPSTQPDTGSIRLEYTLARQDVPVIVENIQIKAYNTYGKRVMVSPKLPKDAAVIFTKVPVDTTSIYVEYTDINDVVVGVSNHSLVVTAGSETVVCVNDISDPAEYAAKITNLTITPAEVSVSTNHVLHFVVAATIETNDADMQKLSRDLTEDAEYVLEGDTSSLTPTATAGEYTAAETGICYVHANVSPLKSVTATVTVNAREIRDPKLEIFVTAPYSLDASHTLQLVLPSMNKVALYARMLSKTGQPITITDPDNIAWAAPDDPAIQLTENMVKGLADTAAPIPVTATYTYEEVEYTSQIFVVVDTGVLSKITVEPAELSVAVGTNSFESGAGSLQATAVFTFDGQELPAMNYTSECDWETSDPDSITLVADGETIQVEVDAAAAVGENGTVTAAAKIDATKTSEATVNYLAAVPTRVRIYNVTTPDVFTMTVGDTISLQPKVTLSNGTEVDYDDASLDQTKFYFAITDEAGCAELQYDHAVNPAEALLKALSETQVGKVLEVTLAYGRGPEDSSIVPVAAQQITINE